MNKKNIRTRKAALRFSVEIRLKRSRFWWLWRKTRK